MNILKSSWSAFSREVAKTYMDGFGYPSPHSKILVASLLRELFGDRSFRLAEFGCGNAQMYGYFLERGLKCEYFGYDFSVSLLDAARQRVGGDSKTHFIEADISNSELTGEPCDIVLFSHVLEALASPERSLVAALRIARMIMIRFFEPPVADHDVVELLQMNLGDHVTPAPYLRRKMSKEYYNMILNKIGCRSVEVHQVKGDKDQVHILRFE